MVEILLSAVDTLKDSIIFLDKLCNDVFVVFRMRNTVDVFAGETFEIVDSRRHR